MDGPSSDDEVQFSGSLDPAAALARDRAQAEATGNAFDLRSQDDEAATPAKEETEEEYVEFFRSRRKAPASPDTDGEDASGFEAPTIKKMKETIRRAGLGVADLLERPHMEERYQQALARLAEAAPVPPPPPSPPSSPRAQYC